MSNSEISRQNIKENTKSLLGEIKNLDDEIIALQGTLFHSFVGGSEVPPFIVDSNET